MNHIIPKLSRLVGRLRFGYEYGLTPIETRCVDAFLRQLTPSLRELVLEHLAASAAVVRFAKGKYVVFKFTERPRESLTPVETKAIELHVATIKIRTGSHTLYCEILFEYGVLAGIEFSYPPDQVDSARSTIEWVRLLVDLDKPDVQPVPELERLIDRPIVARLAQTIQIQNVLPSVDRLLIDTFVERLECVFPESLLGLLNETNGFTFPNGEFMGTQARTLPWPDVNLSLIAENLACTRAVALTAGDPIPRVQFLDEVAADPEPRSGEIVEILVEFAAFIVSRDA